MQQQPGQPARRAALERAHALVPWGLRTRASGSRTPRGLTPSDQSKPGMASGRRLASLALHLQQGGAAATAAAAATAEQEDDAAAEAEVRFEVDGAVASIVLSNERQRNPLKGRVLRRLLACIQEIADRRFEIRVVLLRSEGPVFSSGHDFADFDLRAQPREHGESILALCAEVNVALSRLPQPTIAVVQGLATAGGCQLACSCDLIVCSEKAFFRCPGSAGGGFCHTPGVSLAQKIHPRRALEMLLLASPVPAKQALEWGLVNRVFAHEELDAEAENMAALLTKASAFNMQSGKESFYKIVEEADLEKKYALAGSYMSDYFYSYDGQVCRQCTRRARNSRSVLFCVRETLKANPQIAME
jgi:enoyl-CoA hydratase/carnithine racemase